MLDHTQNQFNEKMRPYPGSTQVMLMHGPHGLYIFGTISKDLDLNLAPQI